jgi:hypothetical protein
MDDGDGDQGMEVGSIWVDPHAIPRVLRDHTPRSGANGPAYHAVATQFSKAGHVCHSAATQSGVVANKHSAVRNDNGHLKSPAEGLVRGPGMARAVNIDNVEQEEEDGEDQVTLFLMSQIGYEQQPYQRERRTALNRVISEIYSPPRVTGYLRRHPNDHLGPGFALDLTTLDEEGNPWDFTIHKMREKARQLVRTTKPLFLIGSPECKAWSTWQYLNAMKRDAEVVRRERLEALVHLDRKSVV